MNVFKFRQSAGICLSRFLFLTYCLLLTAHCSPLFAKETIIKFATIAPEGSTWMKVMQEWNKELIEKSKGS